MIRKTSIVFISVVVLLMIAFYFRYENNVYWKSATLFQEQVNKWSKKMQTPKPVDIDNKVLDSFVFDNIYKKNLWGAGSGYGSVAKNTIKYRELLQKIFYDDRYNSFVDFGCGDFQIMKLMKVPSNKSYNGIDVVADVIEKNRKLYGSQHPNYQFHHVDDLSALKGGSELLKGDMLIVKDVLIHFPNKNIRYFIDNILPNFKYALITNDYSKNANQDIKKGRFRAVDLASPPFNLKNLEVVLEYTGGGNKRVYFYTNPDL